MPTAKPKREFVSGYWLTTVQLDKASRQEFTNVLGCDPPPEFFASLEGIISDFCGAQAFAKTMPRPAEIKAAIKYLFKETKKLAETLEKLDSYTRALVRGVRFRLDSSCVIRSPTAKTLWSPFQWTWKWLYNGFQDCAAAHADNPQRQTLEKSWQICWRDSASSSLHNSSRTCSTSDLKLPAKSVASRQTH
jgi:hypothetical protein